MRERERKVERGREGGEEREREWGGRKGQGVRHLNKLIKTKKILNFMFIISHTALMQNLSKRTRELQESVYRSQLQQVTL